ADARERHEDRLTAHLPLDAATLLVELLPLPFIIAVNTFVGKPWAMGATAVLGSFAVGLLALFGIADLAGLPLLSASLSQQARFALGAGTVVTAAAAAGFLLRPIRKDVAAFVHIGPANHVRDLGLLL